MKTNMDNEKIAYMKKLLWRRIIVAAVFIVINIISAVSMYQVMPLLSVLGIVCAVICLPALVMPVIMLVMMSKADGIILETPKTDPMPVEKVVQDPRSRYLFTVTNLFTSGSEIFELLKSDGVETVEYHLDKLRAEAVLTFSDLNDAKLARNILRIKNYNCTDVRDLTQG